MSDYAAVYARIWTDREFTTLDARPQQVYLMLVSYPTRNLAGVLPLTLRRWANATADATVENLTAALGTLEFRRFLVLDWDTEEVLVRTYIRNDEVWKQPRLMHLALGDSLAVASPKIRDTLGDELLRTASLMPTDTALRKNTHNETLVAAKALVATLDDGVPEGVAYGVGDGVAYGVAYGSGSGSYVSPVGELPLPLPLPATTTATASKPKPPPPSGVCKGVQLVEDAKETKQKRATRLAEDWEPTTDVIDRMKARHPTIDLRAEFEKFQNLHIGKGTKWVDWNRAWWNWIAGAAERQGTAKGRNQPGQANGHVQSAVERKNADLDRIADELNGRTPL